MDIEIRPSKMTISKIGPDLAKAVVAAIPLFVAGDASSAFDAIAQAAPPLADLHALLKRKNTQELNGVCWDIVMSAYATGLSRFFAQVDLVRRPGEAELEVLISDLLTRAEILVQQTPQSFNADHFHAPLKTLFLRDAANQIPHHLKRFETSFQPGDIRRQFEEAMHLGFEDVRNRQPEIFSMFEEALSGLFSKSSDKRGALLRHEEYLIKIFSQQPVFGQEATGITLSDLYVRQRCIWKTKRNIDEKATANSEGKKLLKFLTDVGDKNKYVLIQNLTNLHETIWDWLNSRSNTDCVRVVAGGPGSGKSTFAKSIAIEAIDSGKFDVLFVPLQEIEATGNFESRIANLFKNRTELGFDRVESPLNWLGQREVGGQAPAKPLLLICDGLDEISLPGSPDSDTITADFIQALNNWLANRNSGGLFAKAVVLGRTIAAEEAFKKLGIDWPCLLYVAGLLPLASNHDWKERADAKLIVDLQGLAGSDQRRIYWKNWCAASGVEENKLPEALQGESPAAKALEELTAEPLLLYLLLWTGFLGERWQEAANNRNVVYEEIFRLIHERAWGKSSNAFRGANAEVGGHPLGRHLHIDEFFALQEALGLSSWATGARTVTTDAFRVMLRLYLTEDQYVDLSGSAGISLKSVALQSYTRSAGELGNGYEFVHKTLGEYLIARGLVSIQKRATERLINRPTEGRCRDTTIEIAKIAHYGPLTAEIYRFFTDEVRLRFTRSSDAKQYLESQVIPLINWVVKNGLPLHQFIPTFGDASFHQIEYAERRALDVLWAYSQAIGRIAYPIDQFGSGSVGVWEPGPFKINWPSYTSFTSIFSKLADRGHVNITHRLSTFNFLDLENQAVTELTYGSVEFSQTETQKVRPSAWLNVSMHGCNLRGAEFWSSNLRSADISYSDLSGASFNGANIDRADFRKSNLRDADLSGARATTTTFSDANLAHSSLINATLNHADFSGAYLEGVNFYGPGPINDRIRFGRELRGTDLRGARFERAQIKSCKFDGALLWGADMRSALLSAVDFSAALIRKVDFTNAVISDVQVNEAVFNKLKLSDEQRKEIRIVPEEKVSERLRRLLDAEHKLVGHLLESDGQEA